MFRSGIISLCIIALIAACKTPYSSMPLKIGSDGIASEIRDTSIKDENHYNHDNKIYKVGRIFTFDYYYQDKAGTKMKMRLDKSLETLGKKWEMDVVDSGYKGWMFEPIEKTDKNIVKYLRVTVISGGLKGFQEWDVNYTQTQIKYDLMIHNGDSAARGYGQGTGVIENKKNLWVHPPRIRLFDLLAINPYPYIKAPYKIGDKWEWEVSLGNHWSDRRWLIWEGRHVQKTKYTLIDKVKLKTKLGVLTCHVVEGVSTGKIGTTKLISYFNKKYGFVKLDYTNIDGTTLVLELEKVE